ncbi:MAG: 50S ribosomal protein L28 [Chloroflexi bacterium]|nr:50S ribosomal protein L28 [Chloroflexota bacterium]
MPACDNCHKGPAFGFNVSHSKRHTKRKWEPNIQRTTVYVSGRPKQMALCTRCLRNMTKAAR